MAKNTPNYEFEKPEQNDFYDVDVQNRNWDKAETALTEFDDAGSVDEIKSFPDFLKKFVTGNKLAVTMRNLKAGLQFVLHAGQIVNNCVTDNTGLPLSAAQGKVLKDLYTQLYSDSNRRFLIDKAVYNSLTDLPSKGSCFGVIGNAPILINDSFSIPAYSRFAFINTGDSADGALVAIDANGNIYSAYRNNGIWNTGQVAASKSDLAFLTPKRPTTNNLNSFYPNSPGINIHVCISSDENIPEAATGFCLSIYYDRSAKIQVFYPLEGARIYKRKGVEAWTMIGS